VTTWHQGIPLRISLTHPTLMATCLLCLHRNFRGLQILSFAAKTFRKFQREEGDLAQEW